MADRYFLDAPLTGDRAVLSGAEAQHLARVMRAQVGDEVLLFDGSGSEFRARVERVGRAEVELAVLAREAVDREARRSCTLAVALPKGERQAWLVEKVVELGVRSLVPLVTARGVAQPVDKALERLRRGVIEASKQCGRNRLMEIAAPRTWPELLAAPRDGLRLVAHPGATDSAANALAADAAAPVTIAIGPEGGFSDDEIAAAREAGWRVVSLGASVLRVETAAIALATLATLSKPTA